MDRTHQSRLSQDVELQMRYNKVVQIDAYDEITQIYSPEHGGFTARNHGDDQPEGVHADPHKGF